MKFENVAVLSCKSVLSISDFLVFVFLVFNSSSVLLVIVNALTDRQTVGQSIALSCSFFSHVQILHIPFHFAHPSVLIITRVPWQFRVSKLQSSVDLSTSQSATVYLSGVAVLHTGWIVRWLDGWLDGWLSAPAVLQIVICCSAIWLCIQNYWQGRPRSGQLMWKMCTESCNVHTYIYFPLATATESAGDLFCTQSHVPHWFSSLRTLGVSLSAKK